MKVKVGFTAPDRGCLNTLIQNSGDIVFEIYATGRGRYLFLYEVPYGDPQDIRGYILEFQNFIEDCTIYIQEMRREGYENLSKKIDYDGFSYFKSFHKLNTHISFDMKRKNNESIDIPFLDNVMFDYFESL